MNGVQQTDIFAVEVSFETYKFNYITGRVKQRTA